MPKSINILFLLGILLIAGCSSKDPVVLSPADQLIKDIQTIDDYLAAQKITAVKDPSGLRYVVTTQGTGAKPLSYENVNVNYVGKLLDNGQTFDASTSPSTLQLTRVISGWQIGLPLVNKGSKVTLYIPSGLGYGAVGKGTIPSNANLSFDIELLDDAPQLAKDIAIIDKYLDSLKISAVKDVSGIRYNITIPGAGAKPTLANTVFFTYSAKVLKTDKVFDQSASQVSAYLPSIIIPGLITSFLLIPPGTSVTFYIPSSLGFSLLTKYDAGGAIVIPPNSNLIYTIQFSSFQ